MKLHGLLAGMIALTSSTMLASSQTASSISGPNTNVTVTDHQIAVDDCSKTVMVGTGSTGLRTIALPPASAFPEGCQITIKNGDQRRGKLLSGFPADFAGNLLAPLQSGEIQLVAGAWVTKRAPGIWLLPGSAPEANTYIWHVDGAAGSDMTADGLDPGAGAFASCQHAIDWVSRNVNANQQRIYIQVHNAGQCASINLKQVAGVYDFWPHGNLVLQGDLTTPANTTMNCGAAYCIVGVNVQGWIVQGFRMNSSVGGIESDAGAHVYFGTLEITGNPPHAIACIHRGFCEQIGNVRVSSTAQTSYAMIAFGGNYINAGANTIVLDNALALAPFWSLDGTGSYASLSGLAYAGPGAAMSTGTTFAATHGAYIATGGRCAGTGGGVNIPGNAAGVPTSGWCE
jgi:hypothetical protein